MPGQQKLGKRKRPWTDKRKALSARSWKANQTRSAARQLLQRSQQRANLFAAKLSAADIRQIQQRAAAGESIAAIGKDYGASEFEIARVVRYGGLTPWQAARRRRAARNQPVKSSLPQPAGK